MAADPTTSAKLPIEATLDNINAIVWGPPMLALLLLTGVYLMVGLKFLPARRIPIAFRELLRKRDTNDPSGVSPFGALMTALSSTVGTGNIAGVGVAIAIGGPGAIFWMWMTAIVGTATKYSEAVLAVKYRQITADGRRVGGPMYYIRYGLGRKWQWMALFFSFLGIFTGFMTGCFIQSNSIADVLSNSFNVPAVLTGLVIASATAAVILGGVKRIATVASAVVPAMAFAYIAACIIALILNAASIPSAFVLIFKSAFGFEQAAGGFTGAAILAAIRQGVARGVFSNEAGQGTAPIAHAASNNDDPINQGTIAMLGTVIDTLIICTMTALVILTSGMYGVIDPETGNALSAARLTAEAFNTALPDIGNYIVGFGLVIFGFTTILGWSYYGERCAEYCFGKRIILPFRLSWIVFSFSGAAVLIYKGQPVVRISWLVTDVVTALMTAPNLIGLLLLSPVVFKTTHEYFAAGNK